MTEPVPDDIAAAVVAYGDAMRNLASKNSRSPQATISRHVAKNARDALDVVILKHLSLREFMRPAPERIEPGI